MPKKLNALKEDLRELENEKFAEIARADVEQAVIDYEHENEEDDTDFDEKANEDFHELENERRLELERDQMDAEEQAATQEAMDRHAYYAYETETEENDADSEDEVENYLRETENQRRAENDENLRQYYLAQQAEDVKNLKALPEVLEKHASSKQETAGFYSKPGARDFNPQFFKPKDYAKHALSSAKHKEQQRTKHTREKRAIFTNK